MGIILTGPKPAIFRKRIFFFRNIWIELKYLTASQARMRIKFQWKGEWVGGGPIGRNTETQRCNWVSEVLNYIWETKRGRSLSIHVGNETESWRVQCRLPLGRVHLLDKHKLVRFSTPCVFFTHLHSISFWHAGPHLPQHTGSLQFLCHSEIGLTPHEPAPFSTPLSAEPWPLHAAALQTLPAEWGSAATDRSPGNSPSQALSAHFIPQALQARLQVQLRSYLISSSQHPYEREHYCLPHLVGEELRLRNFKLDQVTHLVSIKCEGSKPRSLTTYHHLPFLTNNDCASGSLKQSQATEYS